MPPFQSQDLDAVLFDLDGTLIDTAPDMVAVLQDLQKAHGIEPLPYALGRANVSHGAIGLLRVGFPDEHAQYNSPLHLEYLERYTQRICVKSVLFDGLGELLDELDSAGIRWGIVTNKPERLTRPLLQMLNLESRSACIVSGDTVAERKPHPAPMLHACEVAGMTPQQTITVGDAARDIEAGRAAGMATIAAAYGYVTEDDDPANWGADEIVADTADLAQMVLKAVTL